MNKKYEEDLEDLRWMKEVMKEMEKTTESETYKSEIDNFDIKDIKAIIEDIEKAELKLKSGKKLKKKRIPGIEKILKNEKIEHEKIAEILENERRESEREKIKKQKQSEREKIKKQKQSEREKIKKQKQIEREKIKKHKQIEREKIKKQKQIEREKKKKHRKKMIEMQKNARIRQKQNKKMIKEREQGKIDKILMKIREKEIKEREEKEERIAFRELMDDWAIYWVLYPFFKTEFFYHLSPKINVENGVKVVLVESSITKDTFTVKGLFNVRLAHQIYFYYPPQKWKYNGIVVRIINEDIGLVEIAVYGHMWLVHWWVVSEKERELDESIYAYITIKKFALFMDWNLSYYKTFYMSYISYMDHVFYVVWLGKVTAELYEIVQVNIRDLAGGLNEIFFGQITYIGQRDGFYKIWIKAFGDIKRLRGRFSWSDFEEVPRMLAIIGFTKSKVLFY